ncbi:hypothetical protein HY572_00400 [Candidatus Micrarchaeota archaeon]|nr:hypothetical protein [Candidatus Micrarchaeota archaeon]
MEPKEPVTWALLFVAGATLLAAAFFAPTPALFLLVLVGAAFLLRPEPVPERVWGHHPQL